MLKLSWASARLLLALGLAPARADAQALAAIGQVLQVRETAPQDVVILRRAGAVQPARAYDWLLAGDRVQVKSPTAAATVFDVGTRRSIRITAADGPRAVGGPAPGGYSEAAAAFFQGFNTLFESPRRPIAVETEARGVTALPPLVAAPLLPVSAQSIPRGQTGLALFWAGGAADITVSSASGALVAQQAAGPYASATLATPPLAGDYRISVGAAGLDWRISTVAPETIPEPPWMAGAHSDTDAERVARAAWILKAGPPSWRLFAASELAELADRNYAADRLWQALRAGDF